VLDSTSLTPDEVVEQGGRRRAVIGRSLALSALAVVGLPFALYGWLHRVIPFAIVHWSITRFAAPHKHKAQISTAAMVAGGVAFGGFYGACFLLVHAIWGWPISLWYGLSLPVASLVAFYYAREIRQLARGLRTLWVSMRAPFALRRLVAMRADLVSQVESAHRALSPATPVSPGKP